MMSYLNIRMVIECHSVEVGAGVQTPSRFADGSLGYLDGGGSIHSGIHTLDIRIIQYSRTIPGHTGGTHILTTRHTSGRITTGN